MRLLLLPVMAPTVRRVVPPPVGLVMLKVALPLRVVVLKVSPAVPEVTLPPPTLSVLAPMVSPPRV